MDELELPPKLQGIFFSFRWNRAVIWTLPTSTQQVPMEELEWHLDLPVWSTKPPEPLFDLSPREVIEDSMKYADHWNRMQRAEIRYALDMFENNGRWVIIDGYHRLARLKVLATEVVNVRKHASRLLKQIRV